MEHLRDQWRSVTAGVKPLSGDVERLGTREQWRKIGSLEIDRRDGLTLYTDANRYGPHQRWWVEGWLGGRIVDVAELVVKPGRVGEFHVETIATDSSFRRQGLMTWLFEAALDWYGDVVFIHDGEYMSDDAKKLFDVLHAKRPDVHYWSPKSIYRTASMDDIAYRGVSLALDERHGVPILEALVKRQRNVADRLVIDAMAEAVKNHWWAAGAQETDEAGRWWTSRKSEAYEYSFSDEGAWMTLPVVMTASFADAAGTGYNDGTYVWHLDPGHPVTITEFEACYPSDPQGLLDAWRGITSPGNFDRPEARWDGDWVKLNIPSMRTTASGNIVFDSVSDDPGRWDSYSQKWPERKTKMTGRTKRVGECTLYLQDYGDDREVFAVIGDRVVGTAYFGYVGAQLKAAVQVDPKYRRRGIATAMYSWIEEIARDTLTPDIPHTPLAEALWNQPNRPFGRN